MLSGLIRESILASKKKKKNLLLRIDLPENEKQRGLDANYANLNANRREDAIRVNLAKCFEYRFFFANRFARICKTLVCESPTKFTCDLHVE